MKLSNMKLSKLIKLSCALIAIISISYSYTSYTLGVIDGHKIYGAGKGLSEYEALCSAVTAVNQLKKERASNYITTEQYQIKVNIILQSLKNKGLKIN